MEYWNIGILELWNAGMGKPMHVELLFPADFSNAMIPACVPPRAAELRRAGVLLPFVLVSISVRLVKA